MIKHSHSPSDLMRYFIVPFEVLMHQYLEKNSDINIEMDPVDSLLELIGEKGIEHEQRVLKELSLKLKKVIKIEHGTREEMIIATKSAMKSGVDLIYQGAITNNIFFGVPDFLLRVDGSSDFGNYQYKILDAKLAKRIKSEYLIQICCYSEMLKFTQGSMSNEAQICLGDNTFKDINIFDFYIFYLKVKDLYLEDMHRSNIELPDPGSFSNWGLFTNYAERKFIEVNHLIQLPDIRESQIQKFYAAGITSIDKLASTSMNRVPEMDAHVFQKFKNQSRMHIKTLELNVLQYEVIDDCEVGLGLYSLPPKSKLDIYFDIESNPLSLERPLHYLWGAAFEDSCKDFIGWWAHSELEMKIVFEEFIDWVYLRNKEDPLMHVYHYGQFEISAIRSLMGLYGTREKEVDHLLRNNVFVDLLRVVKQSLCIGGSGYGLKKIEPLYMVNRVDELSSGGDSIVVYEAWASDPKGTSNHNDSSLLNEIWKYNRVDCISLIELVDWLRVIQESVSFHYFAPPKIANDPEISSFQDDLDRFQDDKDLMLKKPHLKMLSNLCLFHKREDKPVWWMLFDRLEKTDADLVNDLDCLGELVATGGVEQITTRSKGFTYTFDSNQESKVKLGDKALKLKQDINLNISIYDINPAEGLVTLKTTANELPSILSLIPCSVISAKPISTRIEEILNGYFNDGTLKSCVEHFLLRQRPSFTLDHGKDLSKLADNTIDSLIIAIGSLDESYFCIQGPPGTGKTYSGARVINSLVEKGMKVGIASNSHKAINNMLEAVISHMDEEKITGLVGKVHNKNDDLLYENERILLSKTPKDMPLSDVSVVGGTAWTFSNEHFQDSLDYLFIDEAGQVSLANMIGMSSSCKNIILIGDQMQLANPSRGIHPDNSGSSCLSYLLEDKPTIPADQGVLLPDTFRMHSSICKFISSRVYENRIKSIESNDKRIIELADNKILKKSFGIQYIALDHSGNEQSSMEEVLKIKEIVRTLLSSKRINSHGERVDVEKGDILIVTPYNHQVRLLSDNLGADFNIGTVDKFQGREAPVVIISMASSNALSSPRGLSFLFDPNRLNVAISRAQSLAILIGSSELEKPFASNERDMKLTNLYLDLIDYASLS